MKSMEILLGWVLLFILACWTIIDIGGAVDKYDGIRLAFSILSHITVGALVAASIWRDRLA